jgi:hypothetical protein
VADGWIVRRVTRKALAWTFISILVRHPTLIFSPVGVFAPVFKLAAPYRMYSDDPGMPSIFENLRICSKIRKKKRYLFNASAIWRLANLRKLDIVGFVQGQSQMMV